MKSVILALAMLLVLAASAQAATWKPGTSYMITEEEAENFLMDVYDFASCRGIQRFGYRKGGYSFDAEYVQFSCSFERDAYSCYGWRFRTIKGSKRDYFKMKIAREGNCY